MVARGFYRHWKGGLYFVEYVGVLDAEARDARRIVVYHSAQSMKEPNGIRLRHEDSFEQFIDPKTGKATRKTTIRDKSGVRYPIRRFIRVDAECGY